MLTRLAFVFSTIVLTTTLSFAQNKTIFGEGDVTFGGFGGPSVHLTPINDNLGVIVGGYGALLINHQLAIGAGGYSLDNNLEYDKITIQDEFGNVTNQRYRYLSFEYSGAYLEYTFFPQEAIHFNINALIGGGEAGLRERNSNNNEGAKYTEDAFFLFEPGVNMQMNVTQWFRISLGASYRLVDGINQIDGLSDKDFRNVSGNIDFKFGWF